ncbi:hypothetical protein BJ165DRAFT_1404273 [Panaeolus papilionaceus]|nr:hypothetical protein BJ165DRAFT_1404273 [Panaeolus papilionaceus]
MYTQKIWSICVESNRAKAYFLPCPHRLFVDEYSRAESHNEACEAELVKIHPLSPQYPNIYHRINKLQSTGDDREASSEPPILVISVCTTEKNMMGKDSEKIGTLRSRKYRLKFEVIVSTAPVFGGLSHDTRQEWLVNKVCFESCHKSGDRRKSTLYQELKGYVIN